jgi:branched-chain amino acid transport system ATP-binding protein
VLEVRGLTKSFGGVRALDSFDLSVNTGECVALVGPNGAGKTTVFNVLSGTYAPDAGTVALDGRPLALGRPEHASRQGLARTFQNLRPFPRLSVTENVMVGPASRGRSMREARETAARWIEFVGLGHQRNAYGDELSTGQRKRLEVARALAADPKVLLLDEVTAGVDLAGVPQIIEVMNKVRSEIAVALVVIEHRQAVVNAVADRAIAMHAGRIITTGSLRDVLEHPVVAASYLGHEVSES